MKLKHTRHYALVLKKRFHPASNAGTWDCCIMPGAVYWLNFMALVLFFLL